MNNDQDVPPPYPGKIDSESVLQNAVGINNTSVGNVVSKNNNPDFKKRKKHVLKNSILLSILIVVIGLVSGIFLLGKNQDIREKAESTCGKGCGKEPIYTSFNKLPSSIGPFKEEGNLVIYYVTLESGGGRKLKIEKDGKEYEIRTSDFKERGKKERIITGIKINQGENIILKEIEEIVDSIPNQDCAPIKGPPFYSFGWKDPNSDSTCGSALPGPPSQCTPFQNIPVNEYLTWFSSFGKEVLSIQCWADWREWPGDYDFNDFLIAFSVEGGQEKYGICRETRIYKVEGDINNPSSWKLLTSNELSSLKPGDEIYLVALAIGNQDSIEKARFKVNGKYTEETKSIKPKDKSINSDEEIEFYARYKIPQNISQETQFSVKAEIFVDGLWL